MWCVCPVGALIFLASILGAEGHGAMNIPPSRNAGEGFKPGENQHGCQAYACMWFSQGCSIGCKCNEDNKDLHFYSNLCHNGMEPTINDPKFLTWPNNSPLPGHNWTRFHPWRAPGSATTFDPCGIAGGSTHNNDIAAGFGKETIAHQQGFPGSKLPAVSVKTNWVLGSTVEVAWGITANHGGGYQYRACPLSDNLTDACFESHVLPFVGGTQTLRWADGHEVEVNATRVTEGTRPRGFAWTKNPIPACSAVEGGEFGRGCFDANGEPTPQFEPPPGCNETCWGKKVCKFREPAVDCSLYPSWRTTEIPNIVDRVRVPAHWAPGPWVVQWRWDSEETPQVWNGCGDVTLTKE